MALLLIDNIWEELYKLELLFGKEGGINRRGRGAAQRNMAKMVNNYLEPFALSASSALKNHE